MTRWLMRRRVAAWAILGGFALLPLIAAMTAMVSWRRPSSVDSAMSHTARPAPAPAAC